MPSPRMTGCWPPGKVSPRMKAMGRVFIIAPMTIFLGGVLRSFGGTQTSREAGAEPVMGFQSGHGAKRGD